MRGPWLLQAVQTARLLSWSRPSNLVQQKNFCYSCSSRGEICFSSSKRLKVAQLPGWFCGGLKYPAFPFPFPRPFRLKRSVCQGRANIENVVERSLDWLEWFSFSVGTLEPPKSGARRPDNPPRVGQGGNIGKSRHSSRQVSGMS